MLALALVSMWLVLWLVLALVLALALALVSMCCSQTPSWRFMSPPEPLAFGKRGNSQTRGATANGRGATANGRGPRGGRRPSLPRLLATTPGRYVRRWPRKDPGPFEGQGRKSYTFFSEGFTRAQRRA